MYCLIYCINIYILFCYVVELYALRGAEGWWGSQLAWIRNSLIIYVTSRLGKLWVERANIAHQLARSLQTPAPQLPRRAALKRQATPAFRP